MSRLMAISLMRSRIREYFARWRRVRVKHDWSNAITTPGSEYDTGQFHITMVSRTFRVCLRCGITNACEGLVPWCRPDTIGMRRERYLDITLRRP